MDTKLIKWFRWNRHANTLLLNVIEAEATSSTESKNLFAAIIHEHELWLNRICSVKGSDDLSRFASLSDRNAFLHDITEQFLISSSYGENLGWNFTYRNAHGEQTALSLIDAYFQILSYTQSHRGRILQELQDKGLQLPQIDYLSMADISINVEG